MIEVTNEMVSAFQKAMFNHKTDNIAEIDRAVAAGLAAALALVERDYDATLRFDMPYRGWLIEHVDYHDGAPVEGCTFCPKPARAAP